MEKSWRFFLKDTPTKSAVSLSSLEEGSGKQLKYKNVNIVVLHSEGGYL